MKRGFTLVELLAVIVILSVIAIITVPIIGNVIEESKKKALEQSAYGLVSAADYYVLDKLEEKDYHFVFEDGKQTSSDKLDYKGKLDVYGDLYIDKNGDISLCLYNDKYYVIKRSNSGIEIGEKTEERNCAIRPINGKYVAYLTDDGTGEYATLSDLNSLKSELQPQITNNTSQITTNASDISDIKSAIGNMDNLDKDNLVSAMNNNLMIGQPLIPVMNASSPELSRVTTSRPVSAGAIHNIFNPSIFTCAYFSMGDATTSGYVQYDFVDKVKLKAFNISGECDTNGNTEVPVVYTISVSDDGINFTNIYRFGNPDKSGNFNGSPLPVFDFLQDVECRYVRVTWNHYRYFVSNTYYGGLCKMQFYGKKLTQS